MGRGGHEGQGEPMAAVAVVPRTVSHAEIEFASAAHAAYVSEHLTHRHARAVPAKGSDASAVTVIAQSLDAADQVAEDLAAVSGLDADDWAHGWREHNGALAIDVRPITPDEFVDDYIARESVDAAQRRPELEQRVRDSLGGLANVLITYSGTETATGRGYVEIGAKSVADADEAEARLGEIADVSAETWAHGWHSDGALLVLRIFPS